MIKQNTTDEISKDKNSNQQDYSEENKIFFTIAETVQILKIARITVHRRLCTGEIPSLRLGSRVLIPASFVYSKMQASSKTDSTILTEET